MGTRGYKAMTPAMACRGFRYEVGETYEVPGPPRLCMHGFHFCERAVDVWQYYDRLNSIVCEVEALGEVVTDGTKSVTDRIRVVRRLAPVEEGRLRYCHDGCHDGSRRGSGDVYGNGRGNGHGYGYGDGYGDGHGHGHGRGNGNGNGDGMNMNHHMIWED